jgi:hypothetical protein
MRTLVVLKISKFNLQTRGLEGLIVVASALPDPSSTYERSLLRDSYLPPTLKKNMGKLCVMRFARDGGFSHQKINLKTTIPDD